MKFFLILALLAASVAGSIDMSKVRPRHLEKRSIVPRRGLPIQSRITNGKPARPGEIPWQASLVLDGHIFCGGTLVSPNCIVTAAHCTDGVKNVRVTLGTVKSSPTGDVGEVVIMVPGENIVVHEEYDEWEILNDISVIRLPMNVTFTANIQAAILPKYTGTAPTYAGEIGVASGWGLTSDNSGTISPTLQYISAPIIPDPECEVFYGPFTTPVMCIATNGTNKSICDGDSGGPLTVRGTNMLIGTASFRSYKGCEKGWPAGFTRVAENKDWIEKSCKI